jgi:mannose-6-phosphate isomerase
MPGALMNLEVRPIPDVGRMAPMRPVSMPSVRPWAGVRLGGGIGELWLAGPGSNVDSPEFGRLTLDDLAARTGEALVGSRAIRRYGPRFPLLVKVIDAAAWLSLQVHPSDDVAAQLFGPGAVGKTEAWLVLDATAGASLITGPARALTQAALRGSIRDGTLDRAQCEERAAEPGDAWVVPAGTIHAIGAGVLMYEIEQPSDLTFRISDWGRPSVPGRRLHPAEALRSLDPTSHVRRAGRGWRLDGDELAVPQLRLEMVGPSGPFTRAPGGASLEIVTAVRDGVDVTGDGWHETLAPFETLVVPASIAGYEIAAGSGGLACVGSVPAA